MTDSYSQDQDRRKSQRFKLRVFGSFNTCAIALDPVVMIDCALLDISTGGVRVRLNPIMKRPLTVAPGQEVEFREFLALEQRHLTGLAGKVVWVDGERMEFGILFDSSLDRELVQKCVQNSET